MTDADEPPQIKGPKRHVRKIILSNFKKFERLELAFEPDLNVLVGDNEAGKSTLLQAMDLAISGSRSKVDALGIESLMNKGAVDRFFTGSKRPADLPKLFVEIYLSDLDEWEAHGRANSLNQDGFGLRFSCEPSEAYADEIAQVLNEPGDNFPFEFYAIRFHTFADQPYGGPRRYIDQLLIDSALINTEHAHREYTRKLYQANSTPSERGSHQNKYRSAKREFWDTHLNDLNSRVEVKFWLRSSNKASLENDLVIVSDGIPVESKGRGQQSLIKTTFALQRGRGKRGIDVLMLEEPENHLSHGHMRKLVDDIAGAGDQQVFVATHSSMICSRLGLRKAILLDQDGKANATLSKLDPTTAAFFAKAPDHHLLEFAMSRRVILVEGDAEYILIESLYRNCCDSTLEKDEIHVIAVGGTSFKRYLEVACILGVRVAIVRDNDGDYKRNCVDNYEGLLSENARVFADADPKRSTFEICIHQDNAIVCDELFKQKRRTKPVLDYMLDNKAEAALALAGKAPQLRVPQYIRNAIAWIRRSS
jgi:putative ATP-dependent endonuclease of OLD family